MIFINFRNLFKFELFQHLTYSQEEFQPQWIIQRPFAVFLLLLAFSFFFVKKDKRVTGSCGTSILSTHNGSGADLLLMWGQAGWASHFPVTNGRHFGYLQQLSDNIKAEIVWCMQGKKRKKKGIFPILFFHFSSSLPPFCFTSFDSLLPLFSRLFLLFLSLFRLSHYMDKLPPRSAKLHSYSTTGLSIYSGQSQHIQALSNIIPEPIKRPNWKEWKRMEALFLSHKLSVQFWVSDRQHTAQSLFFFITG